MRKTILFKTLVDFLYYLHFIGLFGMLFTVPFGILQINQVDMLVQDWTVLYWLFLVVSLIGYLVFLRGLYFLRKMARILLSQKYFSEKISVNLNKSGQHFLLAGSISMLLLVLTFIYKLYNGKIELVYDIDVMVPLFLMLIGLFFIIQSNTLILAKHMNDENKLTV